jgi:hypothetical protein
MAKTLQFRRGTTSELSSQTGAVGELFVDTTKDTVVVMDGSTAGGFPLQRELLSGTNIKTVNGTSLLGSGDITISGGSGFSGDYNDLTNKPTIQSFNQSLNTTDNPSFGRVSMNYLGLNGTDGSSGQIVSSLGSAGAYWTSIKTINGQSILGGGNITISGGSGDSADFSQVSEDILPLFSEVYDLGSTDKRWYDGYFSNTININGAQLTGTSDGVISTTEFVATSAMLGDLVISDNFITPSNLSVSEYFGESATLVINGNLDIIGDWLNVPVVETVVTETEIDTTTIEETTSTFTQNNWSSIGTFITDNTVSISPISFGFRDLLLTSVNIGDTITYPENYSGTVHTVTLTSAFVYSEFTNRLVASITTAPGQAGSEGGGASISYLTFTMYVTTGGIVTETISTPPSTIGLEGFIRYNKDVASFEGHDGTEWAALGGAVEQDVSIVGTNNIVSRISGTGGSGSHNTFFGSCAGTSNTTGSINNFFGSCAGTSNTTGSSNNFFGSRAGESNTTGSTNNFFGPLAGHSNTSGAYNNFLGFFAGSSNTTGRNNNFFGTFAGTQNRTGCNNNFIGQSAGGGNTTGCNNNFFGSGAGRGSNSIGSNNNFFGCYAGNCNYSGENNNFFGRQAGLFNTTGSSNNFFGRDAGRSNTTGRYNNFFGIYAGYSNTTGGYNNFFGSFAGFCNTTGRYNNFFGRQAGQNNTTGLYNNFFGCNAGSGNITGCNNNFFGQRAGLNNTTGCHNNFFGQSAGQANTTGCNNTFFGAYAGSCNTTGFNNNFFGSNAGRFNTTGCYNNFFGLSAGLINSTGCNNNFFGFAAGSSNTTGFNNNFLGYQAGNGSTTGCNNNFFGSYAGSGFSGMSNGSNNNFLGNFAGWRNISGSNNNFLGNFAGGCNSTGCNNNFFGSSAGAINSTGCNNNFFGPFAGCANTTGNYNIFFGSSAGTLNSTGSNNNFFGNLAGRCNTTGSNNLAFGLESGNDAVFTMGSTDNNIVMGNNSHTNAYIKVSWTVTSDSRDKTNVIAIPNNRSFFAGLKPVQYNWKNRATGVVTDTTPRYGFLAQDIAELETTPRILVDDSDPENLKLRETMMIPVIVNEVQAMNAELAELRAANQALQIQLTEIQNKLSNT